MSSSSFSLLSRIERRGGRYYQLLFAPHTQDEDTRRREFIFNVLLLGVIVLIAVTFVFLCGQVVVYGPRYDGAPPVVLAVPLLLLIGLYGSNRRGFTNAHAYIFLGVFYLLGTYALYMYGFQLPQGILTYALIIIMAGILISSLASGIMTILVGIAFIVLVYVQSHAIVQPDLRTAFKPLNPSDSVIYMVMFGVIATASWLSNREIGRSLARARSSESALRRERNSLEVKVRQRTRQLEQAQIEKMLELHRFAEFGRLNSTLLHDLANPLTSVSLELELLENGGHSKFVRHVRKSIARMEQYVESARRQLRSQSEVRVFDSATEIGRLLAFMEPQARRRQVTLTKHLVAGARINGDSIRFDQIVSNLVGNAIDACAEISQARRRQVVLTTRQAGNQLELLVEDHGIGIKPGAVNKIFEPFYTTKTVEQGTGIGLWITKQAVEDGFGGTLQVNSTPRKSTTFTVRIPLHEP